MCAQATQRVEARAPAAEAKSYVEQYYDALRDGRFLAHKCRKCGRYTFPPTTCCEHCGSWDFEAAYLSGRGMLLYASHGIAPPPHPRFAGIAPYVYGQIMLDEGVAVQAIVRGVEATPQALRAIFERGPLPVNACVMSMTDLPVLAFELA
ncbi:MAG: zinc ribbon domain-containing protein [Burkholderiales bacterium]|nr:zinc ribbon domain-containing protein [Burkholderiales bacterium]